MLGVTSERFPAGGALLLGIMGGIGNISVAITMPILGGIYDAYGPTTALRTMAILPVILLFIFGFFWFRDRDRKSTRLNSSHANISYAVFCLKKKNNWDSLPTYNTPLPSRTTR